MSEVLYKATKIMVIRHAEKPLDPPPHGITSEGKRNKECLTVRGWQRAGALAGLFAPAHGSPHVSSLARPQFLYASKPIERRGSRRSLETITPLAEKLGININTQYPRNKGEEMLSEALTCEGVVLISWQHEYIPEMANHILGDRLTAPQTWPEGRFDVVWVFDLDLTLNQYGFVEVPQCLLIGDSATPIK